MKADLTLLWHPDLPSWKAARAARQLESRDGLQKFRASKILQSAKRQTFDDWYAGADLLDVDQVDLIEALVSSHQSVQIAASIATEERFTLASTTPKRSFDAPPWSGVDACALQRGLPVLTLSPRLAARPRAALCC